MKNAVKTQQAPSPVGPYSQAIIVGDMIFCSGQIGIVPATGKLAAESIATETKQVMDNLKAIVLEAGCNLNNIVKTTIFVTDLSEFKTVNEVYGSYFSGAPPARSTVEVSKLPLGARVEIEAIAVRK